MNTLLNRRAFLGATPAAGAMTFAFFGFAPESFAAEGATAVESSPHFPRQNPEFVREIVGASHFNEERVRDLLAELPELAKSAWDWGFGDWETALGAASHTGRRAIAELLIAHGARPDLFTHAMLGHVDVVRACVKAHEGIQRIPGPHGITLLAHARSGGPEAESVVNYLMEVGDADVGPRNEPLSDEQRAMILGVYSFGGGAADRFEIAERRGAIGVVPGEAPFRGLLHQGDLAFQPVGAPSVRVTFEPADDSGMTATIAMARERIVGRRIKS